MTIYTRTHAAYGNIQSVLIVQPGETGLLTATLLDYTKRGTLVSIQPGTTITPAELDANWQLMHEAVTVG